MSEELVKKVQDMLKEATWTRAAISSYTKNNLIELAAIVEEAKLTNCIDEIKGICDEQLAHSKDSIIALYISGMLGLKKGLLDNSSLIALVDIFQKNLKEQEVIYLCETILGEEPNNKFALRTLADCYATKNSDKLWEVYEKIVKIDFEEADIAKKLAEHYEEKQNDKDAQETAIDYYKKALLRFVAAKNLTSIKEMWTKLVSLIPEEFDFFMLVQRKIAKTISADKSALLLQELYDYYKDKKDWDIAIDLLKRILTIDPKDNWARREITDCFRAKYANHSHVEDYIRSSNIGQSFRNVFEAINDFEKHIAFDVRHFVFHRTWHVGVIRKVENDTLTINFGKKNGIHEMSLKMAVNALQPLSNEHIWVIKATSKSEDGGFATREDMVKKIKNDKAWALRTIIRSFNNSCDFKRIKAELVPSVLTASEWTSWNSAAKKVLDTDPLFSKNPNDANEYIVRDHEITPEEKLSNDFKAQKQFFARVDILMKFVGDEIADKESELFADMFSYFTSRLKSFTDVDEEVVASYLVVQKVGAYFPNLAFVPNFTFESMYREIENPREMYLQLKDTKNTSLRKDFLNNIKLLPDWVEQYIRLFPTVLEADLLNTLINNGHVADVQKLAVDSFDDYRGHRDAILYFFENTENEDWFKAANIDYQKQLIAILNIISQSYREIDNHVDTTENRKVIKNATKLLFDNNTLLNFMLSSNEETMSHLYTLIDDIKDLDGALKAKCRNRILEKYPDYKFHKTEEKTTAPKGMIVTKKMLDIKQAEEKRIQTIEIPKIAKEIAEAREKGDLKENAEYHAAKDAQHKLNVDLKKLQNELARAVIFDPTTATTSVVSFGTEITLLNKDTNTEETYTILGPWESDAKANILSYLSPFVDKLLNHQAGEDVSFTSNGRERNYTIKEIKLAKI